ncbi:MAG: hypothetical protein HYS32_01180 [Candidatus Woesearchaeota archaeon]|nr:MAG: hypothetical protein HYS32_01180 [Candidatus Woesearchaeota archaeon]
MAKFPEATGRLFRNVYVCRRCKTKMRSSPLKILWKKVICKNCGGKALRPIKSKASK